MNKNTRFTDDLIELDSLILKAKDFTKDLMDKHTDGDPLEKFRLYYINDNLRIIRDSISRHLDGNLYPK